MANQYLISIFTPTYNRSPILINLYNSLLSQCKRNFEWIIVDDGSTDDTTETVSKFITENKIPITYYQKENEGKHLAINKGVELARGELFFIVDSDDYLTEDATEKIESYYHRINSKELAGLSFRRGFSKDKYLGSLYFESIEMNVLNFRYRKRVKGDMAEIYKTEILNKFPFPKIPNEKFCPESLVWNRIGQQYRLLWVSEIIYICQYLEDGLTAKITQLRKESPNYSMLYYAEFSKLKIPIIFRIKGAVNFWRFAYYSKVPFRQKWKMQPLLLNLIGWPLSLFVRFLK